MPTGTDFYLRLYWTRKRSSNVTCRDSGCSDVKELKHTCGNDPEVPGNRDKSAIRSWTGQTKNAKEKNNCSRCSSRCKKTIGLAGCSYSQGKLRTSSGNFTRSSRWWPWVRFRGVQFTCGTKVRLSGAELLHDARWETLKHCRLPSVEQVCGLAADLRAEARQAHEDDREKRTMVLNNWPRTDHKAACNWCKGVDNEKIVMVQREDGTHAANAKQAHTLVEQAWIPIFKMQELQYAHCDCISVVVVTPG